MTAAQLGRPSAKATRGTTNSNVRGNTRDRRRRREYLVETYRADVDLAEGGLGIEVPLGEGVPACRCYRCGILLDVDSVQVDRIVPGCEGGDYRRTNIRPNCAACSEHTGGKLGAARLKIARSTR